MNLHRNLFFLLLLLLSGLISPAIKVWGQSSKRAPLNTSKVQFTLFDSLKLINPLVEINDSMRLEQKIQMVNDTLFWIYQFYEQKNYAAQVFKFDTRGNHIATIDLETKVVSWNKNERMPAWTGFYSFESLDREEAKIFHNFHIGKEYIFASNLNLWAIFNHSGRLLAQGYWKAPHPDKNVCYTELYSFRIPSEHFVTYQGREYYFSGIGRNWPEFWKMQERPFPYSWTYEFYYPDNFLLARYEIPKDEISSANNSYPIFYGSGIQAEKLMAKMDKDWGKLKRRGDEMIYSDIAVDTKNGVIYLALASEDQVRVYDWQGNFQGWVGERGKNLAPEDTILPLPKVIAQMFDTLNSKSVFSGLGQHCAIYHSVRRASYQYFGLQIDKDGLYLFRKYELPDRRYLAHAKQAGVQPPEEEGCVNSRQYLQIIDLKKGGKVIYDEPLETTNFSLLQTSAPGMYWYLSHYKKWGKEAYLYRVKMTVKKEE
jgi:hypothetical protein